MSSIIFAYVTANHVDEARAIARVIVADRLAACANIMPVIMSIHHWKGEVHEGTEAVVIFKTRAELFPALEGRVKELHSYDTPCVVALSVEAAHAPFAQWVLDETKP